MYVMFCISQDFGQIFMSGGTKYFADPDHDSFIRYLQVGSFQHHICLILANEIYNRSTMRKQINRNGK